MKGLHLRNEHDVIEYILENLIGRPVLRERLDQDSYVFLGKYHTAHGEGWVVRAESFRGGSPLYVTVVSKSPIKTELRISKTRPDYIEVQEMTHEPTKAATTKPRPEDTAGRCASPDQEDHRVD